MREIVIIADDFTGANDTGVQVRKHGMAIDVILNRDDIKQGNANISIDTESRVIPQEEAYERVAQVVKRVMEQGGCQCLYKKVDSTLRGNLAAEIKAMVAVYQPEIIAFAPAYPDQGRTTKNGTLYVHGTPLLETEIAKDPRNPLTEDNIVTILSHIMETKVHLISGETLTKDDLPLLSDGSYAFDATTTEDLQHIASVLLKTGKKVLWIGSAGLAEGLLAALHPVSPVLAVIGSVSSKTMEQIAFCRAHQVKVVKLDMIALYEGQSIEEAIQPVLDFLAAGNDVLLTAAATRDDYEQFVDYGKTKHIAGETLAEFTKQTLSRAASATMEACHDAVGGMFLTGGDTAIAVTCSLGASGSHIEEQLLPGFVLGRLIGGGWNNLPIVTKAGAFGSTGDIYECMCKLREK